MKVLILGATGMLGNAMFTELSASAELDVRATLRSAGGKGHFPPVLRGRLIAGVDVLDTDALTALLVDERPDVVINCVGLIKQLAQARDPLTTLPVNAMLPHRLSRLCALTGARLVHVSTDCVFSGRKGNYRETDISDAEDLYGKSKYIGELHDDAHAITLRTSIIGHELSSSYALVDWFLSQQGSVKGYSHAMYSGFPTVELARIVRDRVIPRPELHGLYHVASTPISKLALLRIVARVYGKNIEIIPDAAVSIDRTLNGERFAAATGYQAPEWETLVEVMHSGWLARKDVAG